MPTGASPPMYTKEQACAILSYSLRSDDLDRARNHVIVKAHDKAETAEREMLGRKLQAGREQEMAVAWQRSLARLH